MHQHNTLAFYFSVSLALSDLTQITQHAFGASHSVTVLILNPTSSEISSIDIPFWLIFKAVALACSTLP